MDPAYKEDYTNPFISLTIELNSENQTFKEDSNRWKGKREEISDMRLQNKRLRRELEQLRHDDSKNWRCVAS